MKLRDTPDDLFALVGRTSDDRGIPQEFVEKDYWITELLRSAARPIDDAIAILKGGTSLSKAFGLIERFSEDVDVLLSIKDQSFGNVRVHKILKRVCARAGEDLEIATEDQLVIGSETGIQRNVRYLYPAGLPSKIVTEGVLLEMGRRGGDFPRERRRLQSMIAQYAIESGAASENEFEEFAPTEIDVLSPERTLVEKLALLHRLSVMDPGSGLAAGGRHLYDIYKLLTDRPTVATLRSNPETIGRLAADADAQSETWGLPFEPRPAQGYALSPAFDPTQACAADLRRGFAAAKALIYGPVPTFEQCIEVVRGAAPIL